MAQVQADLHFKPKLKIRHVKRRPNFARDLFRTPWGRLMWTADRGDSLLFGKEVFMSQLTAIHFGADGAIKEARDLGSGLVTNVGVNLLANDPAWAAGATLKQMNYHAIGTGSTAAAAADFYLQTANGATNLSGTTNGYMTGTQSYVTPNVWKTVATFTFTGSVAVTERVLTMSNAAALTGRSATSTATGSLTDTGAAFTTAGNGLAGWSVEANSAAINTPTTTAMGQISSNTATVLTLLGGWLTLANAGASTPSGTTNYVVYPSIWDHKVFGAFNAINNDTLQFQYSLTCQSGG
jgi:hypothetical protein